MMSIDTIRGLEKIAAENICAICEGDLSVIWDHEVGEYEIRCPDNRRHQGYVRRPDQEVERVQRMVDMNLRLNAEHGYPQAEEELRARLEEEAIALVGKKRWNLRRRAMVEQQTIETSKALEPYQKKSMLTQAEASMVLQTIWPNAPVEEIKKAAILCKDYGLHPLKKHISLVPFEDKKSGEQNWAIILGIGAKRLLASRRGPVEYLDLSPKIMTKDEQEKINGNVDESKIWAITHVRNPLTGASAYGVGCWSNNETLYGGNKGNTEENMAKIRSESQALDRLFPAEMPPGLEVIEERCAPSIESKTSVDAKAQERPIVDHDTGEIRESPPPHPWLDHCPVHGDGWTKGRHGRFHNLPNGEKCNVKKALLPKLQELWGLVGKGSCNDWLKNKYEGKTWSALDDEVVIKVIEGLQAQADLKGESSEDETKAEESELRF